MRKDVDYEQKFVCAVTLYHVDGKWVRFTYANGTTAGHGTGCCSLNIGACDRGSANSDSNGNRPTDLITANYSADIHC